MRVISERLYLFVFMLCFIASASFFISCADSTSNKTGQGELKLIMVDAPANYDEVNIVITRVEVHRADADSNSGWFVINDIQTTYNLLTLRNGASVVLGNTKLEAGNYSQIRLFVGNGSNVVVNGITHPLNIPGGEQSGIKLNHEFEIQPELLYELILDFDAARSIVLTGNGQYKLKPLIRVLPIIISGSISGVINPEFAAGFVYTIDGTDTTGTIADPLTGSFKIMALPHQTYRVEIFSASAAYKDTTIAGVIVNAMQNTNIGTITLSGK